MSRALQRGVPIVPVGDDAHCLVIKRPRPQYQKSITDRLCVFGFAVYQIYNRVGQFVRARCERVWRWSDVWRSERSTDGKKPVRDDRVGGGIGKQNHYKATIPPNGV